MKYEIKHLPLASIVLSPVPVVLLLMGLVGGALAFLVAPNELMDPMSLRARLTAAGTFGVIYMLLVLAMMLGAAFIYNLLTALGLRGLCLNLEAAEESPEAPEAAQPPAAESRPGDDSAPAQDASQNAAASGSGDGTGTPA
ncbi:MAG: hypothetical protein WC421_07845 [Elusimicrobiales bacterium]